MDDETIVDLKQFIAATIYQHTMGLSKDIQSLKIDVERLDQKIADLSLGVGDALSASNKVIEVQLANRDRRIARLERKTA